MKDIYLTRDEALPIALKSIHFRVLSPLFLDEDITIYDVKKLSNESLASAIKDWKDWIHGSKDRHNRFIFVDGIGVNNSSLYKDEYMSMIKRQEKFQKKFFINFENYRKFRINKRK